MNDYRIVDFEKYCDLCKYKELNSFADPCDDCLHHPANIDSHKPVNFEKK